MTVEHLLLTVTLSIVMVVVSRSLFIVSSASSCFFIFVYVSVCFLSPYGISLLAGVFQQFLLTFLGI